MRTTSTLLLALILGGCADYQFTVNDRVVYTPAPLYADYEIPDRALADCVAQHVEDAEITQPDALLALNCSHAGVTDLAGLDVFSKLTMLKLSDNRIEEIQALADMSALQELHLDGNALKNADPIRELPELEYLDLRDNPDLVCRQMEPFRRHTGLKLHLPRHCGD